LTKTPCRPYAFSNLSYETNIDYSTNNNRHLETLIPADVMVQGQRPDLVIFDRSVHGRHRIALVKLTCPWDTDAKRAKERKTARNADLKTALSNEGWDCSLYLIKVGAQGHIVKLIKDRLRLLSRAWVPADHRSGIGQMMKDVSRNSLVCSFAIFQARNDPVWFSSSLIAQHIDGVPTVEGVGRPPGEAPSSPSPYYPPPKQRGKKGVGHCICICIDMLPIAPVVLFLVWYFSPLA
jgi:hypothetical protein